ncbi:MAG TPA: hypothetical protein VFD90_21580 [Gaiellales bacterium]|nr:hypothetical protein [Gaiellales bacterium]
MFLALGFASQAGGTSQQSAAPWNSVVPSHRVVRGVVGGGCVALKVGDACAATASLFPSAASNVNEAAMGVQGGTLENPHCVGDAERPDPAPGYLCIYPNEPELVNVAKTGEGLLSAEPHPISNGRRGFKLIWSAQAPGSTQLYAVWAYRAP